MNAQPTHGEYQEIDRDEGGLRPTRLREFLGQNQIKRNLSVFIGAARERGEALDHVFLSGPPGLGKTTLAGIVAREMGVEFRVTSAPALEKPKDLAGMLTTLQEGAVFFIDEIHRLRSALEEMLYVAMEDYELDWVIGQGPSARTLRVPLPRFTLIGATTRPGMVTAPLHTRYSAAARPLFPGGLGRDRAPFRRYSRRSDRRQRDRAVDHLVSRYAARCQPAVAQDARLRSGARQRDDRRRRGAPRDA